MRLSLRFGLRHVAFWIALVAVSAAVWRTWHDIGNRTRELQRASTVTRESIPVERLGIQVHRLPVSADSTVFSVYTPQEAQILLRVWQDGKLWQVGQLSVSPSSRRIHFDVTESGYMLKVFGQHSTKALEVPVARTVPSIELPVEHRTNTSLPLTLVQYELRSVRYLELVMTSR